jgi:hypothetical protein
VKIKEIKVNTPPEARTSGKGFRIKEDPERITEALDLNLLAKQVHQHARKEEDVVGFGYGGGPPKSKLPLWRHVAFAISVPESELVVIRHGWFVSDYQHGVTNAVDALHGRHQAIRDLWDGRIKREVRLSAARAALREAWESDCGIIERLAAVADD